MAIERMSENIIDIAKPMESAIIQGSLARCPFLFKDPFKPLQFVHFSDVHSMLDPWDRIMTFINHYEDYLSFGIHTGDYCAGTIEEYTDLYEYGVPTNLPVFTCTGNHDRAAKDHHTVTKEEVYTHLFNRSKKWNVNFMDCAFPMAYYKDFSESNVRLIALDLYFDVEEQISWLTDLLAEAKASGMHVITAMHQPTSTIVNHPETTFHTAFQWGSVGGPVVSTPFEDPIASFVESGGNYVCNLCGHHHHDLFGYTERGVLNVAVEMATCWAPWDDSNRVFDTRSYDCFNVTSVDVNTGVLRLIRIGNNVDYYLRRKTTFCYDYVNKKVVYNGR